MENYRFLNEDRNIFVSNYFKFISIYDDQIYSRNDWDVLSPGQRKYIIKKLEGHNHTQKTGKSLINNKTSEILRFTTSPSLGVNPLNEFLRNYNENDIFFTTPLVHGIFLLWKSAEEPENAKFYQKELEELVQKLPINLEQLKDFVLNTNYEKIFKNLYNDLTKKQKDGITKNIRRTL